MVEYLLLENSGRWRSHAGSEGLCENHGEKPRLTALFSVPILLVGALFPMR